MDGTVIEQRVRAILSEELGVPEDAIFSDARLTVELSADSMDVHSLVMALEDEFNVEIPDHDLGELQTVRQLTHYLAVRVGGAAA